MFGAMWSTVDCPFMLAENFVHEMAHQKLYGIGIFKEHCTGLIANDPGEGFRSPVLDYPRPMTAIVHAVYSYMYVIARVGMCVGMRAAVEVACVNVVAVAPVVVDGIARVAMCVDMRGGAIRMVLVVGVPMIGVSRGVLVVRVRDVGVIRVIGVIVGVQVGMGITVHVQVLTAIRVILVPGGIVVDVGVVDVPPSE
jgi:hypothetical protein